MPRRKYHSIDLARILLLPFVCIFEFGCPEGKIFTLLKLICGAAPLVYFILSGYLVLRQDKDAEARLRSAIKRTAVTFAILCVAYFAISAVYGAVTGGSVLPLLTSPRMWFDFLVLNIWPFKFGTTIWFVQSMLYAYILIYFFRKIKIMRFDGILVIICLIAGLFSGEMSSVVGFELAGHTSLPANFITQALPYIIIGDMIHRNMRYLSGLPLFISLAGCFAGVAVVAIEATTLINTKMFTYSEHLLGMGIIAVSLSVIICSHRTAGFVSYFFEGSANLMFRIVYYISQPIAAAIAIVISKVAKSPSSQSQLMGFTGIAVFIISFVLSISISEICRAISVARSSYEH